MSDFATAFSSRSMKALITFLITWLTATLLLLWLGDHNIYVVYSPTHVVIKERLSFGGQIVDSLVFGGLFSAINTILLTVGRWVLEREKPKAAAVETPPGVPPKGE